MSVRLLTSCSAGMMLANAGSAVAERELMKALTATGKVRMRVSVRGSREDQARLRAWVDSTIGGSAVELIPREQAAGLLDGVAGVMEHGLPFRALHYGLIDRLPVVSHVHSLELSAIDRHVLASCTDRWSGRTPLVFVAPSRSTARRVAGAPLTVALSASRRPPVLVVPHGVDLSAVEGGDRVAGRRRMGVPAAARVLLSLNRITPQKSDYRQLIRAFGEVASGRGTTWLCLAGGVSTEDHAYIQALRHLAKEVGVAERLAVVPQFDDADKKDLLAAGDVMVSLACNPQESFGLVLLEGMAAGLPILATDWNGYPEVVPEHLQRWFVPTLASHAAARAADWDGNYAELSAAVAVDFDALVAAMADVLDDRNAAARAGAAGRDWTATRTWAATAAEVLQCWQAILRPGGARAVRAAVEAFHPRSPVDGLATRYIEDALCVTAGPSSKSRSSFAGALAAECRLDTEVLLAFLDSVTGTWLPIATARAGLAADSAEADRRLLVLLRVGAVRVGIGRLERSTA